MRGLFVTGTDTNVGKTYLSSQLLKSLRRDGRRVGAYKPACSGAVYASSEQVPHWEDRDSLAAAIGDEFPKEWICPQCFAAPLAPPVAARAEGKFVDSKLLLAGIDIWNNEVDGIIVEGVGGWKCPLSESLMVEDFAVALGFPVLVVAANKLGVINHTLLTIESIKHCGLTVAGVILNQVTETDEDFAVSNVEQIRAFAKVPFLAIASFGHQEAFHDSETHAKIDFWDAMQTGKRLSSRLD